MGDAQLDQLALVPGCIPRGKAWGEVERGAGLIGSPLAGLELIPFPPLPSSSKCETGKSEQA